MIRALLLSTLVLNLGLFLGRLSGFIREAFLAATYGASPEADVIVQMLTIPDLLVSILMGGAMGAMLVPEFTQHAKQASKLLYQSCLFFCVVFSALALGLYWSSDVLVSLLAPGFTEYQMKKTSLALGWVVWLIPLTVLSGAVTAFLHAQNKFGVAAMGTLIINGAIIVGLILVSQDYGGLFLVAIFVLIGGALRLLSQVSQIQLSWNPISSLKNWKLKKQLLVRYSQAMLSGSALLLFPVVARALASYEEEGSVALFNYASRLIEFPLAIGVTFLTVVLFPRLAQSFSGDLAQHRQLVRFGVQITIGLSLVAATTLILLNDSYAKFVYGHGNMEQSNIEVVAGLVVVGLLALPLQGVSSFLTSVFNARNDTKMPLLLNAAGLIFFLVTNRFGIFGEGLISLMWGIVASYGLICCLQFMLLKIENFRWRDTLFDASFCLGCLTAIAFSAFFCSWVSQLGLSAWASLMSACFFALLSIFIMALFNKHIRSTLKTRLVNK